MDVSDLFNLALVAFLTFLLVAITGILLSDDESLTYKPAQANDSQAFSQLPDELAVHILEQLNSLSDKKNCLLVSKRLHRLTNPLLHHRTIHATLDLELISPTPPFTIPSSLPPQLETRLASRKADPNNIKQLILLFKYHPQYWTLSHPSVLPVGQMFGLFPNLEKVVLNFTHLPPSVFLTLAPLIPTLHTPLAPHTTITTLHANPRGRVLTKQARSAPDLGQFYHSLLLDEPAQLFSTLPDDAEEAGEGVTEQPGVLMYVYKGQERQEVRLCRSWGGPFRCLQNLCVLHLEGVTILNARMAEGVEHRSYSGVRTRSGLGYILLDQADNLREVVLVDVTFGEGEDRWKEVFAAAFGSGVRERWSKLEKLRVEGLRDPFSGKRGYNAGSVVKTLRETLGNDDTEWLKEKLRRGVSSC
ncbi:hypothetical protein BJ508DRAFT_418148 [Ascobolus immersus RN42]|uniref:F-box domain-containing protein n=1 Tax=Ascobolus immersus RN42 TaxID=1160509 RepID=A0A3N4HNI9_ASCIM|nr:hypothetical protein BJ508DRAFT_418148 [Ascobolus immersus RN42]